VRPAPGLARGLTITSQNGPCAPMGSHGVDFSLYQQYFSLYQQ
jgi:hypothetical protein